MRHAPLQRPLSLPRALVPKGQGEHPPQARDDVLPVLLVQVDQHLGIRLRAELVAFLASERAGYITAQIICIDGGVI